MLIPNKLSRTLMATLVASAITLPSIAEACTSLLYTDARGAPYAGRTMELPMELPYQATFFPKNTDFSSKADAHAPLSFKGKFGFISLTVPDPLSKDLKVVEGLNDQGLSFSVLAFASTEGPKDMVATTTKVLNAIDLGAWALSQFKNVADVKAALEKQPVLVDALLPLGMMKTPFHYTLHDAKGNSIVIEFANGKQNVIDNPIGVMTNGPEFDWHMTNLNNYTFLNNKDHSTLEVNGVKLTQPDSGIATTALPASNTSVGRFVRAVYYSQFAEKAATSEKAITTLAHVMNNFDRPRGISIDNRFTGEIANIAAPEVEGHPMYTTEYTSWTALADLRQLQFNVRSYDQLNYLNFDLAALADEQQTLSVALNKIPVGLSEGNKALKPK